MPGVLRTQWNVISQGEVGGVCMGLSKEWFRRTPVGRSGCARGRSWRFLHTRGALLLLSVQPGVEGCAPF